MWFNGKIVACRVFEQDLIANITQSFPIGISSPNYNSYVPEHLEHLPKFVIIILVMVREDVQVVSGRRTGR